MKRILLGLPLVFLASSCMASFPHGVVAGDGNVVTVPLSLPHFRAVKNFTSGAVTLSRGGSAGASVTIDRNLLEVLDIRVEDGILLVAVKPGTSVLRTTRFVVDAVLPELDAAGIYGSGSVSVEDGFAGANIDLSIHGSGGLSGRFGYDSVGIVVAGSGSVEAACEADSVHVRIAGSGGVEITGSADDFRGEISASGAVAGGGFTAKHADISVNGSGSATLRVEDSLRATIRGSGSVLYRGSPVVDVRDSGSGSVRRVGL